MDDGDVSACDQVGPREIMRAIIDARGRILAAGEWPALILAVDRFWDLVAACEAGRLDGWPPLPGPGHDLYSPAIEGLRRRREAMEEQVRETRRLRLPFRLYGMDVRRAALAPGVVVAIRSPSGLEEPIRLGPVICPATP